MSVKSFIDSCVGGVMVAEPRRELTLILEKARAGDEGARGELITLLGVSVVTVERDWRLARAWIRSELREGDE